MPLPVLNAHGLAALSYVPVIDVRAVFRASWRIDGHGAACVDAGTINSVNKGSRVRTARLTLAGQVLRGFHRLLEGGPVLQGEVGDRDARCARRDRLVAARRLRPRAAIGVLPVQRLVR